MIKRVVMVVLVQLMFLSLSVSNVFALTSSDNTNLPSGVLILLVPFMLGVIYVALKNETK